MFQKYFLKILRKYLDKLNSSKYIFTMIKTNLTTTKKHTTISIPKASVEYIKQLRDFYSQKFSISLTKGEAVAKALEAEFKRNVK